MNEILTLSKKLFRFILLWLAVQFIRIMPAKAEQPIVIKMLSYGWGNAGWSADTDLLQCLARLARNSSGPILETGCGLSTLLFSALLKPGQKLISLEHKKTWLDIVQRKLTRLSLDKNCVRWCPLVDFGEFEFYDVKELLGDEPFELMLIDGPPASTRGGRIGATHLFLSHINRETITIFDDMHRATVRFVAEEFARVLNGRLEFVGADRQIGIIRLDLGQSCQE